MSIKRRLRTLNARKNFEPGNRAQNIARAIEESDFISSDRIDWILYMEEMDREMDSENGFFENPCAFGGSRTDNPGRYFMDLEEPVDEDFECEPESVFGREYDQAYFDACSREDRDLEDTRDCNWGFDCLD